MCNGVNMKYRPEINSVAVGETEVECIKFGTGAKPFILLPGLSIKSLINSAYTVATAYEVFAEEYTVYMILPRKQIEKGLTVRQMADDTAQVLKKLNLTNCCVIGMSMGGMICQWLAIDCPELVKKIVICSSASRANELSKNVMNLFIEFAKKKDAKALSSAFVDYVYSKPFADKNKELIVFMHEKVSDEEFEKFIILSQAVIENNTFDCLEKIQCPILVIGAKGDKVFSESTSVEIAEKTGCKIYLYDESFAHSAYDEAEDYKDRIKNFLDEE